MYQQLLYGQAYVRQQFHNIRILIRDNHEAEVLNIRIIEEVLRNLFRNKNNRPQQGNRDRRDNMLLQFLNLLQQILEVIVRLDRD
jgi:RNA polymerase-interacting CarD/CdnL/TRCF family regulator